MVVPHSGDIEHQWGQVRTMLRDEFGETAFSTWLKPLNLSEVDGDRVVIAVPTQFMRDWVLANYADRIRSLWTTLNPTVRNISLNVRPATTTAATLNRHISPVTTNSSPISIPNNEPPTRNVEHHQSHTPLTANELNDQAPNLDSLGAILDPRFTFDSFVVGKPNEFAVAAAERMATSSVAPFNPLFLYGGVGLGKTHLMHAVGWRARQVDPSSRIVYLSAEKFMYQFVRALRSKDTMSFKELFRSVDVLMVDDVQFIGGKDSTQEEFFHTFNALVDRGRRIVISADRSPSDLEGLEERIRSRLSWGLVADIHPTTYELRLGILHNKAEQLKVDVAKHVIEFLASRITSNVRELEGALNRIVHQASIEGSVVSIDMAQNVLRDLLRANERRVTIDEVQRAVVEHFSLRMSDMQSSRRSRSVARPRQVAMYLAKQLTPRSLPEIGKRFGGRDHTTVMHAVKQIERLIDEDPNIAEDVGQIRRKLQA